MKERRENNVSGFNFGTCGVFSVVMEWSMHVDNPCLGFEGFGLARLVGTNAPLFILVDFLLLSVRDRRATLQSASGRISSRVTKCDTFVPNSGALSLSLQVEMVFLLRRRNRGHDLDKTTRDVKLLSIS